MTIQEQPHFEVHSTQLAEWVEEQGGDCWWMVDGDPYLNARVPAPCRCDELSTALRRANNWLLVYDPQLRREAMGQVVHASDLDALTKRLDPAIPEILELPGLVGVNDRYLWLCWKGGDNEWTLAEDSAATEAFRSVETRPVGVPDNAATG